MKREREVHKDHLAQTVRMDKRELKALLEHPVHLDSMAKTGQKVQKVQLVSPAYLVTKESKVLTE